VARRARHQARHSQQGEPQATFQLRQKDLSTTPPRRERILPPQGLPPHRHPLRQALPKLPRLGLPRGCYRMVDLMSLSPSCLSAERRVPRAHLGPSCGKGAADSANRVCATNDKEPTTRSIAAAAIWIGVINWRRNHGSSRPAHRGKVPRLRRIRGARLFGPNANSVGGANVRIWHCRTYLGERGPLSDGDLTSQDPPPMPQFDP
jgi:hypothetical protein